MNLKDVLENYYATYNSEDPERLAAFYHPEVTLTSAEGTMEGVEAILDTYRYLVANFVDRMTPEAITVEGDTAEVKIRDHFTAKQDVADFLGMSLAAGESFELHLRGSYEFEDGLIRRVLIEPLED